MRKHDDDDNDDDDEPFLALLLILHENAYAWIVHLILHTAYFCIPAKYPFHRVLVGDLVSKLDVGRIAGVAGC